MCGDAGCTINPLIVNFPSPTAICLPYDPPPSCTPNMSLPPPMHRPSPCVSLCIAPLPVCHLPHTSQSPTTCLPSSGCLSPPLHMSPSPCMSPPSPTAMSPAACCLPMHHNSQPPPHITLPHMFPLCITPSPCMSPYAPPPACAPCALLRSFHQA